LERADGAAALPGRFFEDFQVGETIRHAATRRVSMEDNVAFCRLTDNNQPLHLDEAYAKKTPFGRVVVNGLLPIAWAVGVSVEDTTAGTLVANAGYEEVRNVAPVFPGDFLRCETTVVDKRPTSNPDRGLVDLRHVVFNQANQEVVSLRRIVLIQYRSKSQVTP
jgi:acyl dehydratase